MAAVSEPEILLNVQNHSELKALDSDSDSGQGSCEMNSPKHQLERMDFVQNEDSDDEILVLKKTKSKKIIEDSDSEVESSTIAARDELDPESDEDKENKTVEKVKPRRILTALVDSDDNEDSERDLAADSDKLNNIVGNTKDSPQKEFLNKKQKRSHMSKKQTGLEEKRKGKSERRREKDDKKLKAVEKLKEGKTKRSKVSLEGPLLNDSGCLLADGDLFDKEDESDNEEEESLEAIRASLKNKFKSGQAQSFDEEDVVYDESEGFTDKFEKKKERKAARMSKEAIKHMHSETQRLLRESAVSLPYHLPEPKTIHDFFKRRSRPVCQGNAMQLIKSSKYQPCSTDDKVGSNSTEPVENSFPVEEITPQPDVPLQDPQVSQESALDKLLVEPKINTEFHLTENKAIDICNSGNTTEHVCKDVSSQPIFSSENEESDKVTNDVLQNVPVPEVESTTCEQSKVTENTCTNELSTQVKPKLSKVERLRALGIDLSVKPLLRPDDGIFVNLDEPKQNKELEALKERFLKHSMPKVKAAGEKKVNLHIVRKERTADGKEELKIDVVPVTIDSENQEEKNNAKPGEKLQVLKAKLQEAMKLRRDEERLKRQALYKLDNEDMDEEEEEEEEMTDESEEEGYDKDGNEEEEMEIEKEGNAEDLLGEDDGNEEDEAKDGLQNSSIPDRRIPMATESSLMLFKDNSTKIDDFIPDKIDHVDSGCKENDKLADEDDFHLPLTKDSSHNSSFELIGSMIPSYQPFSKASRGSLHTSIGDFRSPSPVNFKTNFISSASKSSGKISEPSLPVEDSQDLYNASPEPKASYLSAGADSHFRFSLEYDTQSQLLDADGFLNVGHNRKYSSAKQRLVMDTMDENAMDANMGELLDLCTGKFKDSQSNTCQPDANGAKKEDMDELLGLCSGKFVSQDDGSNEEPFRCTKADSENEKNDLMSEAVALCSGSFTNGENEENEAELEDFHLLSYDNSDSEEDDEEGEENGECLEDDDEEEAILRKQSKKRKLKLQDFMENEAELSGSDIGSEDEDEGDEDEYEEEAIDEELPSDEELQDQINKIHMKVTMDEDKRRLRLYQERYLADGDLHSDGPGRMRKFRWNNIDDASQYDMFRRDSDPEDQEGDNEDLEGTDLKWRKERFEREQWLREQSKSGSLNKEEEEAEIETESQFMKLAKKVTERTLQRKATVETKEPTSKNPFGVNQPFSLPKMKTGSMLNMPKEVLQKLAAMSNLNPNAPRNSRKFVFQTVSPQKQDASSDKPKSKVRKNISAATPSPKRFKPNSSTSAKSRSIFPLLES
ncbi:PREDICTED: claspin [Nanorana parkeri]|uniref:claspin n=1 Tax=Nanorana parkeri TaxID=125878 RepID=UPI000854ED73|nr:PREDICTED: claspin [Nanorana parkeri]